MTEQALSDAPPAEVGYETRDVNLPGLLGLGAVLACGVAIVLGLCWLFLSWMWSATPPQDSGQLDSSEVQSSYTAPRLQETPLRDYAEFRREQEAAATTYGWVERSQGTVHIPVERAMDLYLERGAPPSWPAKPASEETPP
jgi:hypothetical protein